MTTFIIKHRLFSALYEGWLKSMSKGIKQAGCATDSVISMVYVDISYSIGLYINIDITWSKSV